MSARSSLAKRLGSDSSAPMKTFVLEVHAADSEAGLEALFDSKSVDSTSDAFLHRAHVEGGDLWVDRLDERFWSFHTDLPATPIRRLLHERVQTRRELDWLWLQTQHLQRVSRHAPARRVRTDFSGVDLRGADSAGAGLRLQASGRDSGTIIELLGQSKVFAGAVSVDSIQVALDDGLGGTMNEAVDRKGVFVSSGDSFDSHVQFVRSVVRRYAAFVELLESKSIRWQPFDDDGGRLTGGPVGVHFRRSIPDVGRFADRLFTSKEPFRLWGDPTVHDGIAEVEAVDLHVGQRLRIDIGARWMRIHLERGSCGNTVARLISNLQHRFDSQLELSDPELQSALTATIGA